MLNCDGKVDCSLVLNSSTQGLRFINKMDSYPAECYQGSATFMVSVACTLSEEEVENRQVQGLLIGCLFVAVALYVVSYIDYMRKIAEIKFIGWDIKTVTAGDYTIEFDISTVFWRRFILLHGA